MNRLVSNRNRLLVIATTAVALSIPVSEQLQFDQRIESFFAEGDPDLERLHQSREVFGGDEFVIVAWTEDRLLEVGDQPYPQHLDAVLEIDELPRVSDRAAVRMESLTERLNAIPGVNAAKTQHLAKLLKSAPKYAPARRDMLRLFEGTLIGHDARTTGIVLELLPETKDGYPRGMTLSQIRDVAATMSGEVAVAGEPVQVYDMFRLVEEDSRSLFLVSLSVLSVVLLAMFRGLRWLLAPVGLVLGAVVVTRAILVGVGAELSMVSSMLNSLVTVIGIATFMHVIVHYRDLRSAAAADGHNGQDERKLIASQTLRDMAAPVFWTCLTTGVGFGSLLVSQITPVRSFSVMMCLATGVVLVGCLFVMPATLASGTRLRTPAQVPLEHWLDRALGMNCSFVEHRPIVTGLVCVLLFAVSIPGVFRLQLETDFSRNFKDSSSIVRGLRFIEGRLGGAGSWEVSFDTPERLDDRFLERIQILTERLREETQDRADLKVLSLTDIADLPPRLLGPARMLTRIRRRQPAMVDNFYNEDQQRMRIVLRSREQQSTEAKLAQIATVRRVVDDFFEEFADDVPQQRAPAASGMFLLLAGLIQSLLSDQLRSFVVATAGILLCMTVAFRSLRIGLLSLFPNVFPVALVMGMLGWSGMRVNIGTAMITSVSMGLTVDSTIHYITAFERARRTMSVTAAIKVAHAGAGRAVVFAHLALVAGFLVLTASRFVPLVYFGALLTLSLIGGVFGDLVLLPLLLRWTTPKTDENNSESSAVELTPAVAATEPASVPPQAATSTPATTPGKPSL